jgi:uncharacterized protein YbaR (Trm112 family)
MGVANQWVLNPFRPKEGMDSPSSIPIVPHTLSAELLAVLVCPLDHGELVHSPGNQTLACKKCAHVFPIENGIPNMLK